MASPTGCDSPAWGNAPGTRSNQRSPALMGRNPLSCFSYPGILPVASPAVNRPKQIARSQNVDVLWSDPYDDRLVHNAYRLEFGGKSMRDPKNPADKQP